MSVNFSSQLTTLHHSSFSSRIFYSQAIATTSSHPPQVCPRPAQGKAQPGSAKGGERLILSPKSVQCHAKSSGLIPDGAINCNQSSGQWPQRALTCPQEPQRAEPSLGQLGWGTKLQGEHENENVLGKDTAVHLDAEMPIPNLGRSWSWLRFFQKILSVIALTFI